MKKNTLILIALFFISCSSINTKENYHKSQEAFLAAWDSCHYVDAASLPFDLWHKIDKPEKVKKLYETLAGNEDVYSVHKWEKGELFLILSQDNTNCNEQKGWLLLLPENILTSLNQDLLQELCKKGEKYSDIAEASANLYWCNNSKFPIIEIETNHPACILQYLYIWDQGKNIYKFYGKKCE